MSPGSEIIGATFGGNEFWLWLAAVTTMGVLLTLLYRGSVRRERKQSHYVEGECFGALTGRTGALKGEVIKIAAGGLVLGRVPGFCDVVCDNTAVSRQHAKVYVIGDHVVVLDLESKNGTYVNGRRVLQQQLSDGDIISLGKKKPTSFKYSR